MDTEKIKKIKYIEQQFKGINKETLFQDYLMELFTGLEQNIDKKFPDVGKYSIISEIPKDREKAFKAKIIDDSKAAIEKLSEALKKNMLIIEEAGIQKEIIDYSENVKALIQIIVNYYIVEDKEKYLNELESGGFDLRVILSNLYSNFKG
ncbi:hypothetical protein J7L48_00730 [bacterium]|nr:hypothetical protein [bacterium]